MDEPVLKLVQMWICEPCLNAEGKECHTPGCALFMMRPFEWPICRDLYEDITPPNPEPSDG